MKPIITIACILFLSFSPQEQYQCLPCGSDCDKVSYKSTGECPQCHMQLVKKSTVTFHSVAPTEICDYIKKHPNAVLLDVRTKEEFEGKASPNFGTLKNAINIPVQELESKLSTISHLKNKEVLVFCSHSHRSPRASYMLTQNGFTNVTNMDGGMSVVTDAACKK
jgi:rhodanese-related sulfurtransferase/DNA-directed RNA polymerase subunit RPC12/RpoP